MPRAARAPRAKGWAQQPIAASAERRGHPSLLCDHQEGATPGSPWLPSVSGLPPMVQRAATTRVRSNGPQTSRRGALSPMKARSGRVQGMGAARRTKVACDGGHPRPSPGDAPSWEESARRPDSASALRVGVGLARPGGPTTHPPRSGFGSRRRRWTATPLVASLLPLAVRAGAPAFAGLAGIRKGTLTARPDRQAVGVPSMSRRYSAFVRGGTASPIRASLP
jgi:hypothetical protein